MAMTQAEKQAAYRKRQAEKLAELTALAEREKNLQRLLDDYRKRVSTLEAATVTEQIMLEVERATVKFPTWPTDPLHALAILGEEFGELNKAMLQLTYEPHKAIAGEVKTEAIQTAAMAIRLAMSLDRYEYLPGKQHSQSEGQP